MPITVNGTTGIAGVDGSASTPALQGSDPNTGVFYPAADTVAIATGGSECLRADSSGNVGIGTTSPTQKLDVSGGANVSGTLAMGSSFLRNRFINGDMRIDQRNSGGSVTPTVDPTTTLDRWQVSLSQASKLSVQQNAGSVTPPAGFTNYIGITSLSAYSVLAADYFMLNQVIEGFNVADLGFGTANASNVALSFWVRSSLTGTFGGVIQNSAQNRSYPFSYTINSANTWEKKAIAIPGDTTGTWLTNNGQGIVVRWGLGVGSTRSGAAGAWSASQLFSVTGAVSIVGTNAATFYVTGAQFEAGSLATAFERRQYGQEFSLCQRYYETGSLVFSGNVTSAGTYYARAFFSTTKRAAPTIVLAVNGGVNNFSNATGSSGSDVSFVQEARNAASTGTGTYGSTYTASAEL